MERLRWIDERMNAIDERFDRQLEELRLLRVEMRAGFAELRVEIAAHAAFAVGLLGLLGAGQL